MDYNISVFSDKKLKILVIFLLCILLSDARDFWKFQNYNSTLSRVKRQNNCGFTCDNGDCISEDNQCDGTVECTDGSDETEKLCSRNVCPPYLFRCNYGPCIDKNKICDGIKDCADNSDESGVGCSTGNSACSSNQFRCKNGDCIDAYSICDGQKDCKDGSDETAETCKNAVCQGYLIKCKYGACVSKNARCNGVEECADGSDEFGCPGTIPSTQPITQPVTEPSSDIPSGGCLLLNHPPNGRRSFANDDRYVPNSAVNQFTTIQVICNPGYRATTEPQQGMYGWAICQNGIWLGETSDNICQRLCPPLDDSTFKATCTRNFQTVNCTDAVEGTDAETECMPFYTSGTVRSKMWCRSGQWRPNLGSCEPACGIKTVRATTLIIGGSPAVRGEYPWMVAVYNVADGKNQHICGGSIISRKYVLSAAHCFSDLANGEVYDKNNYLLIAGKFYREFGDNRDKPTEQIRKIENLFIHEYYRGRNQNYQYDIAVLEVNEPFILGASVQPVCVDWKGEFEAISLTDGNKGVVAGWGYTSSGADPSTELKKVILPFHNQPNCKEHLPSDFYNIYYTPDKICAGYVNQSITVCSGDSGGGYYFQSNTKYYVRAIVSLSATSETGCDKQLYGLYTKLSAYHNWLESKTGRYV